MNKRSLWSREELQSAFGLADFDAEVSGISIDSRTTEPGDLFIALSGDPGPRFSGGEANARDGHDYIDMAVKAGATAVMAHREINCPVPVIAVDDTLDGLWYLGRCARKRSPAKTAAITGSSGKTTIKSWMQGLLGPVTRCHVSEGSLNNHWGVPLSLSRMPADCAIGVFEIGTNHPGEISPLAGLVEPDVALVLNVLPAHIGNFADMDELRAEKLSISQGLGSEGVLVLPVALARYSQYPNVMTFGPGGDVQVEGIRTGSRTQLQIDIAGRKLHAEVPFVGAERIESLAAMFAVLEALGLDLESAAEHAGALVLPAGRGNVIEIAGVTVIDDSYNANPVSMKMSLNHLASTTSGKRRIALLGEMLELGSVSESAHQAVGEYLAGIDEVYTFGRGFSASSLPVVGHFNSIEEFDLEAFAANLGPGDCVLVKGSNKVFWKNDFVNRLTRLIRP